MSHAGLPASRSPGLRRGIVTVGLLVAGLGCAAGAPDPAAAASTSSTPLVLVLRDHVARSQPSVHARRVETVAARRPLTHVRTVLPVLGYAKTAGHTWVHVWLPGRPTGHKGWIRTTFTRRATTKWRLAIDLSARRVTAYYNGHVERRFRAVVGKASTPTPRGRFFIEEGLALASQVGGPFALATSARSDVLQEFEGGPGQIAIHGTNGLSGALDSAASHGCIRLSTPAITWLAHRVGSGVPLRITT